MRSFSNFFRWLFPCRFDEPLCLESYYGCRCGKKKSAGQIALAGPTFGLSLRGNKRKGRADQKQEQRATDLASQQAAQAATTQQAVQAGTAPTPQEQARINATFGLEQQQLPGLQARAGALPEDLVRQIGPTMAAYQQLVSQRAGQTGQQLLAGISPEAAAYQQLVGVQGTQTPEQLFAGISPTAATLAQAIQQRLLAPPTIPYESTTLPEFQLIQEQINNEAARRGFGGGSGLTFEKLGRAGVDLAIRQAQLRQQNALQNEQLRQQSLAAGGELVWAQQDVGEQAKNRLAALINSQLGLTEQARGEVGELGQYAGGLSAQARAELANYLANQQQLSEAARGRQTQGLVQSYQVAQPFQQNAAQFNLQGLDYLNQRALQRRQDVRGLGQLAGTVAAIGLAGPTGGLSLASLPAIGGYGGFGYNPSGSAGLLGGMRQANASQPYYGGGYQAALQQYPGLADVYQQYPQRRNWWGG